MIEYQNIEINKVDDYDKLLEKIEDKKLVGHGYAVGWIQQLKDTIGTKCDCLLIEYPYYDSEFLSSYYQYYIRKFKDYGKKSCRIHFMRNEEYMGYVVVRPNCHCRNLSKSYLSPSLFVSDQAYIMLSEFKASIYGNEYSVRVFPWMNQQNDFSVCAHVAAWSIMKLYGNEHTGYKDVTIGEIVQNIPEHANRKLPSKGLNLQQIADVFRIQNATPVIGKKNGEKEFFREMLAYIESGIPVVAAMDSEEHAVAVIGHGKVNYELLEDLGDRYINTSELITTIIVNDDNRMPYLEIGHKEEQKDQDYSIEDIDFMVIPLYNRIHLEYPMVYERVMSFLETDNLELEKQTVIRIYLTSAKSLKKNCVESELMNDTLKDTLLRLELPKFVWCVDLASKEQYKKEKAAQRIIIDSTASEGDSEPWLLAHDGKKILFFDGGQWHRIDERIEPYNIYKCNLGGVKYEF